MKMKYLHERMASVCLCAASFSALLGLSACSLDLNNPTKTWYYPRAGSKLILHETLTIAADSAALYIQHGKITGSRHSRFDPYCKIRIRNVKQTKQHILPDTFTITHSRHHTELVAGLSGLYIPLESPSRSQI